MATVGQLCKKTIWINEGRVEEFGPSDEVIQSYLSSQKPVEAEYIRDESRVEQIPQVLILGARIRNNENQVVSSIDGTRPFSIEVDYRVTSKTLAWIGFAISTRDGAFVLSAADGDVDAYALTPRDLGVYTSVCYIPEALFNAQDYLLTLYACRTVGGGTEILDYLENVIAFGIENPGGVGSFMPKRRVGVISPRLDWEMKSGALVEPGDTVSAKGGNS